MLDMRTDFQGELRGKVRAIVGLVLASCFLSSALAQTLTPYTTYSVYDSASRVVGTVLSDPDGTGPLHFSATRNTYNAQGMMNRIEKGELSTWPISGLPSSWTTTVTSPQFTVYVQTDYTYDSWGRKLTEQTSGVTSGVATPYTLTQYTYDAYGRVQCVAVRMTPATYASLPSSACQQVSQGTDRITQTSYDLASHPLTIQRGVGTSSAITYETYVYAPGSANNYRGPVQSITDANGNLSSYSYDTYLRLQYLFFPSKNDTGQSDSADYEQYGNDLNGNLTSLRKRDTTLITNTYDALNRVTWKHYSSNATDVYYGYDLRNLQLYSRFSSATGPGITNTYDGFGNLTTASSNVTGTALALTYAYDADGDRTSITFPDTNYFVYGYDGLDRVNLIKENGSSTLASFNYNSQGKVWTITRGGVPGSGVATTTMTYDPILRLQTLGHDLDGPTTTTNDVTYSFTYVPSSQIATRNISTGEYAYTNTASSTAYLVNGLNQYRTLVGTTGINPTYDANGNLTNDGVTSYTYDAENRLLTAISGQTLIASYDPKGRLSSIGGGTQAS